MKIKPDFSHKPWKFRPTKRHKLHRPPSRLVRDNHKVAAATNKLLLANGHQLGRWRYWYGHSTVYCRRCWRYFQIKFGDSVPTIAPCPGPFDKENL